MAVPDRRPILRWFHGLEDDPSRAQARANGWSLMDAAIADDLIDANSRNTFADLVIRMADDDLIDFDHPGKTDDQFGLANPPDYELQHAVDFRSTEKGRRWLAEPAPAGTTVTIQNSTVGQVAAGDINNLTVNQFFDAVVEEIDKVDASEDEREAARDIVTRLREEAATVATGAGSGVLAQAISRLLGLG